MPLDVTVLPLVRDRVRGFLDQDGLDEELVEDVVLCIQEACKNAIRHSGSARGILVRVAMDGRSVRIVVTDYGVGMREGVLELTPQPMAESGRGLHIIRMLMDTVDVRVDGGTEVRMSKRLPASAEGQADRLPLSA